MRCVTERHDVSSDARMGEIPCQYAIARYLISRFAASPTKINSVTSSSIFAMPEKQAYFIGVKNMRYDEVLTLSGIFAFFREKCSQSVVRREKKVGVA